MNPVAQLGLSEENFSIGLLWAVFYLGHSEQLLNLVNLVNPKDPSTNRTYLLLLLRPHLVDVGFQVLLTGLDVGGQLVEACLQVVVLALQLLLLFRSQFLGLLIDQVHGAS